MLLSTSTKTPLEGGPRDLKQIPFRAFVRVFPTLANGRRWELIRDLEKIADFSEEALIDIGLTLAQPVAFTPQFAQVPARITIVGFDSGEATEPFTNVVNASPVEQSTQPGIIHSGTIPGEKTAVMTPRALGGDLSKGQDPTDVVDARVAELRSDIETALAAVNGVDKMIFMDYNGVKYGYMPNKKGFRSFPLS